MLAVCLSSFQLANHVSVRMVSVIGCKSCTLPCMTSWQEQTFQANVIQLLSLTIERLLLHDSVHRYSRCHAFWANVQAVKGYEQAADASTDRPLHTEYRDCNLAADDLNSAGT